MAADNNSSVHQVERSKKLRRELKTSARKDREVLSVRLGGSGTLVSFGHPVVVRLEHIMSHTWSCVSSLYTEG